MGLVAMLGLSSGGTGNAQTDGSNGHLSSDVDILSVDCASQPPTDKIVSSCALELSILDLTLEQEDTVASAMAWAQARWPGHSGTGTMFRLNVFGTGTSARARWHRHDGSITGTISTMAQEPE
jgi:hypothetical protein